MLQKRIDYLVGKLVPFKGRFVRAHPDGVLVEFDTLIDASRYAEYVSDKCHAHLITIDSDAIDFNSGVMVLLSVG